MPDFSAKALNVWSRVPAGCHLELGVGSGDATFLGYNANARVLNATGDEEEWGHDDLRGKPKSYAIGSPLEVRVAVTFASQGVAEVYARVVKADGTTYGSPYKCAIGGKAGDTGRVSILAMTTNK
jgi:hypothetical protein